MNNYGDSKRWFVGFVVEVIDENYVRVRIFGTHNIKDRQKLPDTDIPPALVLYPTTGGQSGSGSMSHNLTVDTWVTGFFADGDDQQYPVVDGVINGSVGSMSTYSSQSGAFVGEGSTATDMTGVDVNATTNIPGGSNPQKVYNYVFDKLKAEGASNDPHLHISALIGALQVESLDKIDPAIEGGYKGRAWGICQWLDPRRAQMFQRYGPTKRLDQQLDFMWWELNNTESTAKRLWLGATSLPDAVAGWAKYERADDVKNGQVVRSSPIYKKRLSKAYAIFNSMQGFRK